MNLIVENVCHVLCAETTSRPDATTTSNDSPPTPTRRNNERLYGTEGHVPSLPVYSLSKSRNCNTWYLLQNMTLTRASIFIGIVPFHVLNSLSYGRGLLSSPISSGELLFGPARWYLHRYRPVSCPTAAILRSLAYLPAISLSLQSLADLQVISLTSLPISLQTLLVTLLMRTACKLCQKAHEERGSS